VFWSRNGYLSTSRTTIRLDISPRIPPPLNAMIVYAAMNVSRGRDECGEKRAPTLPV
jgi:hypothetical protein